MSFEFDTLEFVSRYRAPQLQVCKYYLHDVYNLNEIISNQPNVNFISPSNSSLKEKQTKWLTSLIDVMSTVRVNLGRLTAADDCILCWY